MASLVKGLCQGVATDLPLKRDAMLDLSDRSRLNGVGFPRSVIGSAVLGVPSVCTQIA